MNFRCPIAIIMTTGFQRFGRPPVVLELLLKNRSSLALFMVAAAACLPVASAQYFVNQDASAHLYNAHLMEELLAGGGFSTQHVTFNTFALPNASGHWIMLALLQIMSPFAANKVILIGIFFGTVASTVWLRRRTHGGEGTATAVLFGAALGLNSFWLIGTYNFMIAFAIFIFGLGLYHRWRESMNLMRAGSLALVLIAAYLSHIIGFAMLGGSVLFLSLFADGESRKRAVLWTLAAFVPALPLISAYRALTLEGGGFFPHWRSFDGGLSLSSLALQIAAADPFGLMSKWGFPFTDVESGFAVLLSPSFWVLAAICALLAGTIATGGAERLIDRDRLPYLILFVGSALFTVFGPDDFGAAHGGVLRGRTALCCVVFFIALFDAAGRPWAVSFAAAALVWALGFQSAALWEYSLKGDRSASEVFASKSAINDGDGIALMVLEPRSTRFCSSPEAQLTGLLGFERDVIVWDNYELGHHLFPVVTTDPADKQFILDYNTSTAVLSYARSPGIHLLRGRAGELDRALNGGRGRITKLIVLGSEPAAEEVLAKWFYMEPVFSNGSVRVLRSR